MSPNDLDMVMELFREIKNDVAETKKDIKSHGDKLELWMITQAGINGKQKGKVLWAIGIGGAALLLVAAHLGWR